MFYTPVSQILRDDLIAMYAMHLAGMLPGEVSIVQSDSTNPVFMFGTFDSADEMSSESIGALDEAILGIREAASKAATHSHCHAEVAADASSNAFMFGVDPEQPSPATVWELPTYLSSTEMG